MNPTLFKRAVLTPDSLFNSAYIELHKRHNTSYKHQIHKVLLSRRVATPVATTNNQPTPVFGEPSRGLNPK